MAYSKITLNGTTLMDVTQDTVDAGKLKKSITATAANGERVVGTLIANKWNVTEYGIEPDTGDDLYSDLYDFLMDNVNGVGGVVYFPTGRYVISDTIIIPPNTTFIGDGYTTEIYYNGTYTTGQALMNGGDHCGVMNMRINTPNTSGITVSGSNLAGIVYGTSSITGWSKHSLSSMTERNTKDVFAINVYSDSDYLIKTETGATYTIENVTYDGIDASGAAVIVSGDAKISNVNISNVVCAVLMLGRFSTDNVNINCMNVHCGRLISTGDCRVSNLVVNDDLFHDQLGSGTGAYASALVHVAGDFSLDNALLETSTKNYIFERRESIIRMNNVKALGSNANFMTYSTNTGKNNNWYTNIYTDTKSTIYYGYAANFHGTISSTSELHEISYAPIYIQSDTNLNDYTLPGIYQCDTSAKAQSLSNCPVTDGFVLSVYAKGAYNIQELTNGGSVYVRNRTSGGWQAWYKTTMTAV